MKYLRKSEGQFLENLKKFYGKLWIIVGKYIENTSSTGKLRFA